MNRQKPLRAVQSAFHAGQRKFYSSVGIDGSSVVATRRLPILCLASTHNASTPYAVSHFSGYSVRGLANLSLCHGRHYFSNNAVVSDEEADVMSEVQEANDR